jgi:hypothetical protein
LLFASLIFRGIPFYASPELNGNCLIEVFKIKPTGIEKISFLDKDAIAKLIYNSEEDFTFNLVDF